MRTLSPRRLWSHIGLFVRIYRYSLSLAALIPKRIYKVPRLPLDTLARFIDPKFDNFNMIPYLDIFTIGRFLKGLWKLNI